MKHIPMNKDHADKALLRFKGVADDLGLDWCLFAGSALGMYRDGRWITHDDDIDLAVKATPEELEKLWPALYEAGFNLGRWCENVDGTKNRHIYYDPDVPNIKDGGILVDVFYTFTDDEENLTRFFDAVPYKDELYRVPHPVQAYLQLAYGEWWNKENRNAAMGKEGVKVGSQTVVA